MRSQFIELMDHQTEHGVLVNLERVTHITERTDRKSRIHFAGSDEVLIVRESLAQILDKLPRSAP